MISVGIGEYAITDGEKETIITYALGTCVAVVFYCPYNRTAAMAHIVLPENTEYHSNLSLNVKREKPSFYATEIIPLLVNYFEVDKRCKGKNLQVHVIGGADSKDQNDFFLVGKRNVEMVKRLLKHFNLHILTEETGGHVSRTVSINTETGSLQIKRQDMII